MVVLIIVLVWRNNSAEGFFALKTGNPGTATTTYYIDVKYTQKATTAFASTTAASSISVDPNLTARIDEPITLDAAKNIVIPIGNNLNHLPVSAYVYYASSNTPGNIWDNTPQYTGYSMVPGQIIKAINGNINIATLWSTIGKDNTRYNGTWDTKDKERTLARIYLTFLNS